MLSPTSGGKRAHEGNVEAMRGPLRVSGGQ